MPDKGMFSHCYVCRTRFYFDAETSYDAYRRHLARCRAKARPRRRFKGKRR
jgi:hypothetical protein